ncbi:disease resistance protein RPV1-like [Telopea speciosissima]|uniref:disease resistance protein RPV1-like n=1 Tax=Telopea speciosissima TaxID=54955 RepID=UPI001CC6E3B7|nr:disease resistance protein RPV1-like [Telopea speciosissima]
MVEESQEEYLPSLVFRWDVFLSFRGADTRHNFTDSLYKELELNNIRTFIDDEGLEGGESGDDLSPSLSTAIKESASYIAVISENYASSRESGSSRWCLEELAQILETKRRLLPVFYKVDPSDVRRQKGPFEDDFLCHERRHGEEKVRRWRCAMEEAGGKKGWDSSTWKEDIQLIRDIVKKVLPKVNNSPLGVAKYPVGINLRVAEIVGLLDMKSHDVRVVGLHGMGGVGKTTLAKAVYNRIAAHFNYRYFVPNIRDASRTHNGLVSLKQKLNHELNKEYSGGEVVTGVNNISEKRVLIVLDDVDDVEQLHALVGNSGRVYSGCRIIITTRNKRVLSEDFANFVYEVKELSSSESLQLFSYHAFGRGKPAENFLHLSNQIVSLTGRLPLALEVFGASMFNKKKEEEWEAALEKLRNIQPANVQEVLKISYDALDEEERCIFLDTACFFVSNGMEIESAIDIFKGCGFNAEETIKDLKEKSLIKILDDNTLWMHDQLRDMGQAIVRQEDLTNPGKRSRLWDHDDVMAVLDSEKGTGVIQGIILDFGDISESKKLAKISNPTYSIISCLKEILENILDFNRQKEKETKLCTVPFQPMVNLRLLQINHAKLEGTFKHFPPDLKWLQWKGCPLEVLPSDFCLWKLAVLDLSKSKIKQVWNQRPWWGRYQMTEELQVLNLYGCYNLTATPDFSEHSKLVKLILEGCTELRHIHKSIGYLSKLRHFNLRRCENLEVFPNEITRLRKLETLIVSSCYRLTKLPDDWRPMKSLTELLLDNTAIVKLPDSIFHLEKIERLDLKGCLSLKQLPISIGKLPSLRELTLDGSALEEIPESIGSLKNLEILSLASCKSITAIPDCFHNLASLLELFLNDISIEELPDSIGCLSHLEHLSVSRCRFLSKLPASIGLLASLVELHLDMTPIKELPNQIGDLNMLQKLIMIDCKLLACLPNSIGKMSNLTTLILQNCILTELPESICLLEKLEVLKVNKCKQLSRLPDSIGKLSNLCRLQMKETAVAVLPEDFGMLSNLRMLRMAKMPCYERPQNVEAQTEEGHHKSMVLPASFSNLSLLYEFDACYCKISGAISDGFENLSSLQTLKLGHNNICSLPSSLMGLSVLTKLSLPYCAELKSLPPLPSSLVCVDVTNCTALETISDLSNLESLEELCLANCQKVVDIPGVECLKSLRRLYMSGCTTCHAVVKRSLSKVTLKQMQYLSTPGSEIPSWFVPEVLSFSSLKNRRIKGIVICVVISLDQQIQRPDSPGIVDIRVEILDNSLRQKFCSTFYLPGVPETNEDQFYFCRYAEWHPLVFFLHDGYKMQVTRQNPPIFTGLELKKYGIHLVFEDDDDYNGDEESLDETQLSLSEKLVKFFSSL